MARARRPEIPAWRRWVGTFEIALVLVLPNLYDACDAPPRFASMQIKGSSQDSYNTGDTVEYECRPGYRRNRSLPIQTVCNNDGTWTDLQDACTKKPCPHPQVPQNGEITNTEGSFLFGSEAHYSCFEGFRLIGQKVLYCELIGNAVDWSDNPPLCEKILCRPPENIPNGKYSNSHKEVFEYSEVVTYTCNPSTGSNEYSLVGTRKRVCSGDGEWSGTPPECKVVVCPYPVVNNGAPKSIIPKKRLYNTTVAFECLPGFVLQGSNVIRCDEDNNWKPALPTCVQASRPTDATTTRPSTRPGSKPTTTVPTPASRDPGSKPTTTVPTPASRDPGDNIPTDQPPDTSGNLGAGIIVVIVLVIGLGLTLIAIIVYKCLQGKKREAKVSEVSFSTYRSKSSNPEEES